MQTPIVIGACFGDEGKGLLTDYLSGPNTLVVRFNGGAQAAHTVVTPKQRHVFCHLGSGSLAGASTYLSQFFIVNPFLWQKEISDLGFKPKTIINPNAPLTTPYDMLINQAVENARGNNRHGSCGCGINETVERVGRKTYETRAGDCLSMKTLTERLIAIRECYVLSRMNELTLRPDETFLQRLYSEPLLKSFLSSAKVLARICDFAEADCFKRKKVVFEGAQGLLLDQDHEFFPHVTRSNTGLKNALEIADEAGLADLHAYYVMRTYMTRHGAGPFPTEDAAMSFPDPTNAPNDWQGSLRFGELDAPLIASAIKQDLGGANLSASLVVTHLDQYPQTDAQDVASLTGFRLAATTNGPTRDHVRRSNAVRLAA